jgi:predicted solute-binding protein
LAANYDKPSKRKLSLDHITTDEKKPLFTQMTSCDVTLLIGSMALHASDQQYYSENAAFEELSRVP